MTKPVVSTIIYYRPSNSESRHMKISGVLSAYLIRKHNMTDFFKYAIRLSKQEENKKNPSA